MKTTLKMCAVALLATVVIGSLVGCTEQRFGPIDQPYTFGDTTYVALTAYDKDSCGISTKQTVIVGKPAAPQMDYRCPQQVPSPQQQHRCQHQAPTQRWAHPAPKRRPVDVCQPYQPRYVLRENKIVSVAKGVSDGLVVQALAGSAATLINAGGNIAASAARRPSRYSGGNNNLSQSQSQAQAQAQAQEANGN